MRLTKLKKVKRKRKHGYLSRVKALKGRVLLKRRRDRGRRRLAI